MCIEIVIVRVLIQNAKPFTIVYYLINFPSSFFFESLFIECLFFKYVMYIKFQIECVNIKALSLYGEISGRCSVDDENLISDK